MLTTSHTTLASLTLACTLSVTLGMTLGGCSSAPKPSPRVFTKDVRGTEGRDFVTVAKGQTLSVKLRADAAAGYKWRMSPSSQGDDMVSLTERTTEQDGSIAWDVFTFNTRGTGSTSIEFFCDRPAETEPLPSDKRFTLNVQVTKQGTTAHASASGE